MRSAALAVLFSLLAFSATAADLSVGTLGSDGIVSPGSRAIVNFYVLNAGSETITGGTVHVAFAPFRLESVHALDTWSCSSTTGSVDCAFGTLAPQEQQPATLSIFAPDDEHGGRFPIVIDGISATTDTNPSNNHFETSIAVTHVVHVTQRETDGPASLRAGIEDVNASCDRTMPCLILFDFMTETAIESVFVTTPLPLITACDLTIDRVPWPPDLPQRPFSIIGSGFASGSGLRLQPACADSSFLLRRVAVTGFGGDGVLIGGELPASYRFEDAALIGNGSRGLAIDSPNARTLIGGTEIRNNQRSGVFVWRGSQTVIEESTIDHNHASGVFAGPLGGALGIVQSSITFHPHFGVALSPGSKASISNSIVSGNYVLDIDWKLDGPTPNDADETDGIPNTPRIESATYDAAANVTRIAIDYHSVAHEESRYEADVYASDGLTLFGTAHLEQLVARTPLYHATADGEHVDVHVVVEVPGDLRGKYLSALVTISTGSPLPESSSPPSANVSEVSAAVRVE